MVSKVCLLIYSFGRTSSCRSRRSISNSTSGRSRHGRSLSSVAQSGHIVSILTVPKPKSAVVRLASSFLGTHASFANFNLVQKKTSTPLLTCQEVAEYNHWPNQPICRQRRTGRASLGCYATAGLRENQVSTRKLTPIRKN